MMHQRMPHLPPPTSWYPGHMTRFTRMLPTLLNKTDVVLELRDSRLPLTSINRNLEGKYLYFDHGAHSNVYTLALHRPPPYCSWVFMYSHRVIHYKGYTVARIPNIYSPMI
jgi:hypothetical protein